MKYPTLFISCVGSNMWGMNYPGSDIDRIVVFQVPTRMVLDGSSIPKTLPQKKYFVGEQEYDDQFIEIGHLVNLLIKCNINAIWTTTSPVILQESAVRQQLAEIVRNNLSREVYYSVRGMATSQYKDAMKEEANLDITKKMATAKRTLQFGIRILKLHEIEYAPISRATRTDIENSLYELDRAYEESTLPDKAKAEPFRWWLYVQRANQLYEEDLND